MAAKSSVYHCRAVTTYQCEDCLCNPASAPVYIGMKMQSVIVSLPDFYPCRICSVFGTQRAQRTLQIIQCDGELCVCATSGQIKVSLT